MGHILLQGYAIRVENNGATYQRAMVALFHDMIHHEIEGYVDDMIARSQTEEENLDHL